LLGLLVEMLLALLGLGVLSRPARELRLLAITGVSLALRFAVGMALYLVSLYHLPIFRGLQTPGGFWTFSIDASTYNGYAHQVAAFLSGGGTFPVFDELVAPTAWFFGWVYWLFGAGPPQGLLANAALASACAPLAFYAGRFLRWPTERALIAAFLVGFWPSTFAWSGQVMKDPLQWFAVLCIVAGAAAFLRPQLDWRTFASAVAFLVAGELIASRVRSYLTPIWLVVLLVGAACFVIANRQRPRYASGRAALFVSLLTLVNIPSYSAYLSAADFARPMLAAVPGSTLASGQRRSPANPSTLVSSLPPSQVYSPDQCAPAFPLLYEREGFVAWGGATLTGGNLVSCEDVLRFVPKALELIFLAPVPTDWLQPGETTGVGRQLAALDAVVLWLLVPGLAVGALASFARPTPMRVALCLYVVLVALTMGIAVANFGTLFRLRMQVLLPAVLIAVDGWSIIRAWVASHAKHRASPQQVVKSETSQLVDRAGMQTLAQ